MHMLIQKYIYTFTCGCISLDRLPSDGSYYFSCLVSERHLIAPYVSSEWRRVIMVTNVSELHLIPKDFFFFICAVRDRNAASVQRNADKQKSLIPRCASASHRASKGNMRSSSLPSQICLQ